MKIYLRKPLKQRSDYFNRTSIYFLNRMSSTDNEWDMGQWEGSSCQIFTFGIPLLMFNSTRVTRNYEIFKRNISSPIKYNSKLLFFYG